MQRVPAAVCAVLVVWWATPALATASVTSSGPRTTRQARCEALRPARRWPPRTEAPVYRLIYWDGSDCAAAHVADLDAGAGLDETVAYVSSWAGRAGWTAARRLVLLAPHDTRVRLAGVHTSVGREGSAGLVAVFRVQPAVSSLPAFTFTVTVPQAPGGRAIVHGTRENSGAGGRLPPQGVYEECPPYDGAQCVSRLRAIASAGFRVVLNYTSWYGTATQVQDYATAAHELGLQLIWPLNYVGWRTERGLLQAYPDLAHSCGCTTDPELMRFAIGLVSKDPATWGYYVADEPPLSAIAAVGKLATTVRAIAPGLPLLAVLSGVAPDLGPSLDALAPRLDAVGTDYYPIGTGAPIGYDADLAGALEHVAELNGTASVLVLQAFDWAAYPAESPTSAPRWPTRAEMRAERSAALASGHPALLLWYSFHDIWRDSASRPHWPDLRWAAFGS